MTIFGDIYRGRRVLVTGHTGFKGSWLACWLTELGAEVSGLALDPVTSPSLWEMQELTVSDHRADIRDAAAVEKIFAREQPDIVFHLAAQALVRRSYREPLETLSTNVMGTAHVLEAARRTPSVRAVVCVTTDKVYRNFDLARGYHEDDVLGGHDIYSASKAAAEIAAASYRSAFFENGPLLATARAGNVIGGGDWSEDRLLPDLVRAAVAQQPLTIRSPQATRPWQHVLEPLSGYLMLGWRLLEERREYARGWNFGPDNDGNRSVAAVLETMKRHWPAIDWRVDPAPQVHEARLLHLDSSLAQERLGWIPVWTLDESLEKTALWYQAQVRDGRLLTLPQLNDYVAAARRRGAAWAGEAAVAGRVKSAR